MAGLFSATSTPKAQSSAFALPKIKKPLLLGKHGDKPQKNGLSLPSLKLPSIRSLLAGGLK